MVLSILICTLESRKEQLKKLHEHLSKQVTDNNLSNEVEILIFEDDGKYPVGMKRNALVSAAQGDFICFVDDDDWVSDNYVNLIYNIIKDNPTIDCVGVKGMVVSNDIGNKQFIHSLKYKEYSEDMNFYYRPPNHLNPIRKNLVITCKFPIQNFGEDFDWAMNICKDGILKNEAFINEVLYFYNFEYIKSRTQNWMLKKKKRVVRK